MWQKVMKLDKKLKEKNNTMDKETVIKTIKALYRVYNAAAISHAYVMNDMLDSAMYDYTIEDEEDLIKFIENNIK